MTNDANPLVPIKRMPLKVILQRMQIYLKPQILILVLAAMAMAVVAATEAGIAALLKPLIDKGFGTLGQVNYRWIIPGLVVGLALVRGLAQYSSGYLLSYATNRILLKLRLAMFENLLKARAVFFQRETTSTIINALVYEVNQVLIIFSSVLVTLVRDLMTVAFLLGWLFYLNWRLTLIIAFIMPLIAWLVGKINRRLRKLNFEFQQRTNALSYVVEEVVAGYKVMKMHHGENYEMHRFATISHRLRGDAMRMTISGGLAQPITQLIASCALAIILMIAIIQSSYDQTTVGGFVSFVTAMLLIISPLKHVMDVNQPLQRGATAAELILMLIDEPAEKDLGTETIHRAQGKICFENVFFQYPNSTQPTLKAIHLKAEPGQMIALVGPSGGGKTTLVNLLPRFFEINSGLITLDDKPIQAYRLNNLRQQIAFVSQDVVLFNDTLASNIAYGQVIDQALLNRALTIAYLHDMVDQLEEGINTVIGDNGMRLSGGQRQRLAIARAVYKDAPILILDEATSALDTESEHIVRTALEMLMQSCTTLVIAHRLSTIEKADCILVLDEGRIVESGTHASLLANQATYAKLQGEFVS